MHLEVVAATDVLLGNPDLGDGGPVGSQGRHGLPHLRSVRFLRENVAIDISHKGDVKAIKMWHKVSESSSRVEAPTQDVMRIFHGGRSRNAHA